MGRSDKLEQKKKNSSKRVLKRSKGGIDDDDDSSVDSKGNIRNLIDYDYTSEESQEETYVSSQPRTPRVQRKAAIAASNKINKIITNEMEKKKNINAKNINNDKDKNKNKPSPIKVDKNKNKDDRKQLSTRNLTPSKRKSPFKMYMRNNNKRRSISKKVLKYNSKNDKSPSNNSKSTFETSDDDMDEYEDRETEFTSESDDSDFTMSNENESDDVTEEEEDEIDDDEEEYDENDSDYTDEGDEEDEPQSNKGFGGILLTLGGHGMNNTMTPKKYNMKKEPENVKKFVKLLTNPPEDNTIDSQITQFKALTEDKQKNLINALENRPIISDSGINLMLKILTLKLPPEIQGMILSKYNSLQNLDTSSNEYFKLRAWLDKVVSIPFGICKDIPVRLDDGTEKCAEFMNNSKKCLDDAVYGLDESKLQIMQFIGTKIANPEHRGLSLLFIGPPGVGKTSIIKNGIAKALGWPFQFISLGGDSDASTYTGHQLVYESSHCGKIVNSLITSKSMSTVLMFDEVDKISQTPKGEEVMNLLIHLTDPVQNADFEDKYLAGVPIDLSKVMFVFSANDISKIDKVLLDRMMIVDLKGYDIKQKTTIAEQYLLPAALKDVNLTEKVSISKEILTSIIEEYASEEKGVRELKRCIEQITQKINMLRMFNSPDLPFYIKDFTLPFIVKKEHIKLFLKKKENKDIPPQGMYT